jgi:hypothetical protein
MTAHTYDLYLGGARTTNPDTRMFPSAPFNPLAAIKAADHKNPIGYAITRVINPGPQAPVTTNGGVADQAITNFLNFQALTRPVVATDILRIVPLPNGCLFDGFYWEVETPLAGFTFSVGYARIGNGSYVGGANSIPDGTIGTILLATQSGAAKASGFVDAAGTALTADTSHACASTWIGGSIGSDGTPPPSDALCLRIDALATVGTGAANFGNLRLKISPLVRELVRGQW